jgi:transglutaminase-like putative cysteine protease
MREANWDEVFQKRRDEAVDDDRLSSIIPWEEWLTLVIVATVFLSCIVSIQGANWVDDMPSLYPIGFAGLIAGYALAKVKLNQLLLHAAALMLGAGLVYLQLLAILSGGSAGARTDQLVERMRVWWSAVTQSGISNDSLPVIVLMLTLTWLGAYASSWAIFRWRNAWLGLIPSGLALMWNISFIPGQFSYAFVVYCFGAVLLVMRLHLAQKQKEWDSERIAYPEFMSLSVLHATFWVAVGLLTLVWIMPLAHRSESAQERWNDFTSPVTRHLAPYARVFVSVNAKKPIAVHNIKDALPFQGEITLNGNNAAEINVQLTPEMARFLREQSFDEYTSSGWKINVNGVPLEPGQDTGVDAYNGLDGAREQVTINVTIEGGNDEHLFSVGQPAKSDEAAEARIGEDPADISSLEPQANLSNSDTYSVTGSVAVPTIDQLLAAGTNYPAWVTDRYLELPENLPERVGLKADEVAAAAATPYDETLLIERYLRTFPVEYSVPVTPPGRDTIDYFLFDLQEGYFDYHASAMAVMLRTRGIPARVATGYVIDPLAQDGATGSYALTQKNAYAWPEVYFPSIGWVEFSPTPDQPIILRRLEVPVEEPAPPPGETLPANEDGFSLGENDGLTGSAASPGSTDADGSDSGRTLLFVLGGTAIVAAAIALGGRFAWEFGLGGLSQPARFWEKTQRLARLGSAAPTPHETPREFASRLRRVVPGSDAAGYLATTYEQDRYGHKDLTDDDAEKLESAWVSLRGALLRRILRLKPRN